MTLDVVHDRPDLPVPRGVTFSREQVELIKRTIARGATDDELELFLAVCRRTGLDPFARQAFAVKRWDSNLSREVMSVQTSIDGYRLIADRACRERGWVRSEPLGGGTEWRDAAGVWHDVWVDADPPLAARYTLTILGPSTPAQFSAVARFESYAQRKRNGDLTHMWAQMPDLMIAKCAEALTLRKAFPAELAGLYTTDEMSQATVAVDGPQEDAPYGYPVSHVWTTRQAKHRLVDLVAAYAAEQGAENVPDRDQAKADAAVVWATSFATTDGPEPERVTEAELIAAIHDGDPFDVEVLGEGEMPPAGAGGQGGDAAPEPNGTDATPADQTTPPSPDDPVSAPDVPETDGAPSPAPEASVEDSRPARSSRRATGTEADT